MIPDLDRPLWRKSSYSGGTNGDCVEVALGKGAAIRDSKNPYGGSLAFTAGGLLGLLTSVKAGRFDR